MRIVITDCSDSLYWYNSHVGEEFEVINKGWGDYLVRTPSGYTNIVKENDCMEIDDE